MAANLVFSHISGGRALLRFVANATVNVVANSTVNSDLSTSNDQILGATITKIIWSTPNNIKVARGANNIVTLNGSGSWDLKSMGIPLTEFTTGNINVTITDTNSTLLMECSKLYANGTL